VNLSKPLIVVVSVMCLQADNMEINWLCISVTAGDYDH
jgi:hypothetical protein